jgi:hypothetical protein
MAVIRSASQISLSSSNSSTYVQTNGGMAYIKDSRRKWSSESVNLRGPDTPVVSYGSGSSDSGASSSDARGGGYWK